MNLTFIENLAKRRRFNMKQMRQARFRRHRRWYLYVGIWILFPSLLGGVYSLRTWENAISVSEVVEGEISRFDPIIRKYSRDHGLDWRFVASIIEAESSFRPHAVSQAGAMGLMQIMPVVAQEQRVERAHEPEENIRAGVSHFRKGFNQIEGVSLEDTLKLTLAAYNAGLGHLRDAQRLAVRLKRNPRRWKDIAEMFELLQHPRYYSTLRHGFCQGGNVVSYVKKVYRTFERYRRLIPSYPESHYPPGVDETNEA